MSSSVSRSPADIFLEAKALEPRLSGLSLEYELAEAVLVAYGSHQILIYLYHDEVNRVADLQKQAESSGAAILVLLPDADLPNHVRELSHSRPHFDFLTAPFEPERIARKLLRLLTNLKWEDEAKLAREELQANRERLKDIQQIGIALSAERDLDRLLNMIVEKARMITHADAGSLYIVEGDDEATGIDNRRLRFKVAQNDSIVVPFTEFTIPISPASIAGNVAYTRKILHIDDVYHLPPDSAFKFNRSFDEKFAYRTKSSLSVPLINRAGEMIGVLQLLNRKKDFSLKLTPETTEHLVSPFSPADIELVESLASTAAVALENAMLYVQINKLFESFVEASVTAIEARDPTTSGHSGRVATLTVGLAEKVDRVDSGPHAGTNFSIEQIREIRYASLLHDFGKIGVKEEVLVKAEKLYPTDFKLIEARFRYVKKALEADFLRKQNTLLFEKGKRATGKQLRELEEQFKIEYARLDRFMQVITEANRPSVLAEGNFEVLQDLARTTFTDLDGSVKPLLTEIEVSDLSLMKGSLNEKERRQIEGHVTHTKKFLDGIRWTRELRHIPRIAGMHHEKLNGKGYPDRAPGDTIPLQSRMMTISDIYDALTASDRPYKKAIPPQKALDIISFEVKDGMLDPDLFRVFVESEVYKLTVSA